MWILADRIAIPEQTHHLPLTDRSGYRLGVKPSATGNRPKTGVAIGETAESVREPVAKVVDAIMRALEALFSKTKGSQL